MINILLQAYLEYMERTGVLLGASEADAEKDMADVAEHLLFPLVLYFLAGHVNVFPGIEAGDPACRSLCNQGGKEESNNALQSIHIGRLQGFQTVHMFIHFFNLSK